MYCFHRLFGPRTHHQAGNSRQYTVRGLARQTHAMPSMGAAELRSVVADQPGHGWLCYVFKYETSISQSGADDFTDFLMIADTGRPDHPRHCSTSVIHFAFSPDKTRSAVCFPSSPNAGWHGRCSINNNCIAASFNRRGAGFSLHTAIVCKQTVGNGFGGWDNAGRRVRLTFLEMWTVAWSTPTHGADSELEWQCV